MQPPAVQSLDEILASLQPGYAQQEQLYNQQIAAIPGQTQGAIQGLDVAKDNSFRDINSNANSKGMAFSGMPSQEQTRYVGEKYLPARAALESDAQNRKFTLEQTLAGLNTEKRNLAMNTRNSQQKAASEYQMNIDDRNFKAQQAELDRRAAASAAAASRASSQITPQQQRTQDIAGVHSAFSQVTGKDGYVSPQSYIQAKSLWTSMGYNPKEFDQQFASFRNPKNKAYKLG